MAVDVHRQDLARRAGAKLADQVVEEIEPPAGSRAARRLKLAATPTGAYVINDRTTLNSIRTFLLALLIGIAVGTYSSIFFASVLLGLLLFLFFEEWTLRVATRLMWPIPPQWRQRLLDMLSRFAEGLHTLRQPRALAGGGGRGQRVVDAVGAGGARELRVTVSNHTKGETTATVALELPAGWTSAPRLT